MVKASDSGSRGPGFESHLEGVQLIYCTKPFI